MRRRGNKNELLNRHLQLGRICNMVLEDDAIIAWLRYVGCVSHAQFLDTFQLLQTLRIWYSLSNHTAIDRKCSEDFRRRGGGEERDSGFS